MKGFLSMFTAFVLLFASGCSMSSGDDTGGSGADFDSTLYYTRTQVDDLLKYAVQIAPANGTALSITQTGFLNGASFTLPYNDIKGIVMEVFVKNGAMTTKTIGLALTSTDSAGSGGAYIKTLPFGAYSQEFVYFPNWSSAAGSTIVVWQDSAQAYGTAASDLTDMEIKVNVIQWVRPVK